MRAFKDEIHKDVLEIQYGNNFFYNGTQRPGTAYYGRYGGHPFLNGYYQGYYGEFPYHPGYHAYPYYHTSANLKGELVDPLSFGPYYNVSPVRAIKSKKGSA